MDAGAWWAAIYGVAQSRTRLKRLSSSSSITRDIGLMPGSGRSSRVGNGNPLQYSCLQNPMNRGAQQAIVHRVAQSRIQLKHLALTHVHELS